MTKDERESLTMIADTLEVQIEEILPQYARSPREIRIAMDRLEEAVMWMRKAMDRM